MTHHTAIETIDRHKRGVQILVRHGHWPYCDEHYYSRVSEARKRGQMLWAKTRLAERGDNSTKDMTIYDVETRLTETQITITKNW